MGEPRVSVKALVFRAGRILLTKKSDSEGDFYIAPGGGQEHGETMPQTLEREVREETGYIVKAGELFFVREYIGANHEFAEFDGKMHQVELYFRATLQGMDTVPVTQPDTGQIGVEWVELGRLERVRLYPQSLREKFVSVAGENGEPDSRNHVYVGDVN